ASILNHATILLEDGVLRINVGPVPAGGKVALVAADIEQIWTRKTVTEVPGNKKPDYIIEYNVELRLKKGKTIVIVRGLDPQDQALYIEQALEHALGIIDVAVSEEERQTPWDND